MSFMRFIINFQRRIGGPSKRIRKHRMRRIVKRTWAKHRIKEPLVTAERIAFLVIAIIIILGAVTFCSHLAGAMQQ
jgi:hypothetical protein